MRLEYLTALADGTDVWCDRTQQPARTANGHCQYCGSTRHEPVDPLNPPR